MLANESAQEVHLLYPIVIIHNLLDHRLSNRHPRSAEDLLSSVQEPEIIPHIHISRVKLDFHLMRITTHDLLEFAMRSTRPLIALIRTEQIPGKMWVPAN